MSRWEWHPFTISSGPEWPGLLTLHVRAVGGWTNKLHSIAAENKEGSGLQVYIDGPHSAPASAVFSTPHAVLVATGIGVTPFASILHSVASGGAGAGLQQVTLVWVTRDYRSLEWFLALLAWLEARPSPWLRVYLYVTTGPGRDQTSVGLALALQLLYTRQGRDSLTGKYCMLLL